MDRMVGYAPAAVDLDIYRGDDFAMTLNLWDVSGVPVDLTGASASAQIRAQYDAADVLAEFVTSVDGSSVVLVLDHVATAALPAGERLVWDVQVTSAGGMISTVAGGLVVVSADVTRSTG